MSYQDGIGSCGNNNRNERHIDLSFFERILSVDVLQVNCVPKRTSNAVVCLPIVDSRDT